MTWMMALILGLCCTRWFFSDSPLISTLDQHTLSTTPDQFITELTVQQFDTEGQLIHYFHTPLLHHIQADDTHWVKTPHLVISQAHGGDWEIDAREATAHHSGTEITWNKNVVAHQKASKHSSESTLRSESITYFPKDKLATTLLDVTYEQPGQTVQSKGMRAYIGEQRLQLLSQAQGTYDPSHG